MDASELRQALQLVARTLKRIRDDPRDWRVMSERQHLELALASANKALVGAHGDDHLVTAAARLQFALETRERARHPNREVKPTISW
jgi:hypothetical protein